MISYLAFTINFWKIRHSTFSSCDSYKCQTGDCNNDCSKVLSNSNSVMISRVHSSVCTTCNEKTLKHENNRVHTNIYGSTLSHTGGASYFGGGSVIA